MVNVEIRDVERGTIFFFNFLSVHVKHTISSFFDLVLSLYLSPKKIEVLIGRDLSTHNSRVLFQSKLVVSYQITTLPILWSQLGF